MPIDCLDYLADSGPVLNNISTKAVIGDSFQNMTRSPLFSDLSQLNNSGSSDSTTGILSNSNSSCTSFHTTKSISPRYAWTEKNSNEFNNSSNSTSGGCTREDSGIHTSSENMEGLNHGSMPSTHHSTKSDTSLQLNFEELMITSFGRCT